MHHTTPILSLPHQTDRHDSIQPQHAGIISSTPHDLGTILITYHTIQTPISDTIPIQKPLHLTIRQNHNETIINPRHYKDMIPNTPSYADMIYITSHYKTQSLSYHTTQEPSRTNYTPDYSPCCITLLGHPNDTTLIRHHLCNTVIPKHQPCYITHSTMISYHIILPGDHFDHTRLYPSTISVRPHSPGIIPVGPHYPNTIHVTSHHS